MQLRVVATFTDDLGAVESIESQPTIVVGDLYVGNVLPTPSTALKARTMRPAGALRTP